MKITFVLLFTIATVAFSQLQAQDSIPGFKKRVLENTEIDFLGSYYSQDGNNAAVSGGRGTEELTDAAPTVVVSIPMNDDDILSIDASVSAYTSASSSNVNPFDNGYADPFIASSGASSSDTWFNVTGNYSHSSDDRNRIVSGKLSVSNEYDYMSFGAGGSYSWLFNQKNTEVSLNGNVYIDTWKAIYPYELRPFEPGGNGLGDALFNNNTVTGEGNYAPQFSELDKKGRNSYSLGLNFSQILSQKLQGSLMTDIVYQQGLLSTPFQRVYFADQPDFFIDDFQLADDIERLPDSRLKLALGGRLNYYLNETFVLRSYYRYYSDDWGIASHTAELSVPVKLNDKFTVYPSYRYYTQTAADYFAPYESHLSTEDYYTSDYDLSDFNADQYGIGVGYTDIYTRFHIGGFGLKSIDFRYQHYSRNSGLNANLVSGSFSFTRITN